MTWKTLASPGSGDQQHFSGADINRISNLFSGVADADGVDFNSTIKLRHQKLVLRNPANTFDMTFRNPVISTSSKIFQFDQPYSYVVFIDADDSNLVKVKNGHTGAIESSNSNARISLQYAIDQISTSGKIFIKKGTYVIDQPLNIGATDGSKITNNIQIQGASREAVTIQFGSSPVASADMIDVYCNLMVDNVFLDCNSNATAGIKSNLAVYLMVSSTRIKNSIGTALSMGMSTIGCMIRSNWFDISASTSPQLVVGGQGYNIIESNYFDRTSGIQTGNNITVMGGASLGGIVIRGNVFNRTAGNIANAIQLDPVYDQVVINYFQNIIIDGNTVVNGSIVVGGSGTLAWSNTIQKILVTNNNIDGGSIDVIGPVSNYNSSITYVDIVNNTLENSYTWGILSSNVGGPITISQNTLYDSNKSLVTSEVTGDGGLIEVKNSSTVDMMKNHMFMTDLTANASPYAIRINSNSGIRIFNNKISNVTTNPSIVSNNANTNVRVENNLGYITRNTGKTTFVSASPIKSYVVDHGLDVIPEIVLTDSGTLYDVGEDRYVDNITDTSFTINYNTIPSNGTSFDAFWVAEKVNFN